MLQRRLTLNEWQRLYELGKETLVPAGAVFIEQNKPSDCFYLIVSGLVQVQRELGGGRSKVIAEFGPDALVGEFGFLGVPNRSANVVALANTRMMRFMYTDVHRMLEQTPDLALKLYRGMCEELVARLVASNNDLIDTVLWAMNLGNSLLRTKQSA